jgi:hypothetical protein
MMTPAVFIIYIIQQVNLKCRVDDVCKHVIIIVLKIHIDFSV